MTGHIIVREPGSYRGLDRTQPIQQNGRYLAAYWGSIDEQIAEATAQNLSAHSGAHHTDMELWQWSEDCEHTNPEDDEKFEDVHDLVNAWFARNIPGDLDWLRRRGMTSEQRSMHWDLDFKNRERAYGVIPLAAEWQQAQREYDDHHEGPICRLNPMGTTCLGCTEGDDDSGYEPGSCSREDYARDAMNEFWYLFSTENQEELARERA